MEPTSNDAHERGHNDVTSLVFTAELEIEVPEHREVIVEHTAFGPHQLRARRILISYVYDLAEGCWHVRPITVRGVPEFDGMAIGPRRTLLVHAGNLADMPQWFRDDIASYAPRGVPVILVGL